MRFRSSTSSPIEPGHGLPDGGLQVVGPQEVPVGVGGHRVPFQVPGCRAGRVRGSSLPERRSFHLLLARRLSRRPRTISSNVSSTSSNRLLEPARSTHSNNYPASTPEASLEQGENPSSKGGVGCAQSASHLLTFHHLPKNSPIKNGEVDSPRQYSKPYEGRALVPSQHREQPKNSLQSPLNSSTMPRSRARPCNRG